MPRRALPVPVLEAGFVLAWSSGFIGTHLAIDATGHWTLLAWRFALVAAGMAAVAGLAGAFATVRAGDLARAAVIGWLAQGLYLVGVFRAMDAGVPAGLTALIAALQPLLVATVAGRLVGERSTALQWMGLAVGLAGVALAVAGDLRDADLGGVPATGYLWPLLSVAAISAATLLQRRWASRPLTVDMTAQCAASAALFALIAAATGQGLVLDTRPDALAALAWLAVFSTLGGYCLLWAVVARRGANRAAALVYLTPPTTALWAYAMLGERLGAGAILGLVVTLIGVAIAGSRLAMRRPPAGAGA